MNRWIKMLLWLSLSAVMGVILAKCIFGQQLVTTGTDQDPAWLEIQAINPGDKSMRPETTVIYSRAQPIVWQLAGDRWQITFRRR